MQAPQTMQCAPDALRRKEIVLSDVLTAQILDDGFYKCDVPRRTLISYANKGKSGKNQFLGASPEFLFEAGVGSYVCPPQFDRNCLQIDRGQVWANGRAHYVKKLEKTTCKADNMQLAQQDSGEEAVEFFVYNADAPPVLNSFFIL